GRDMLTYIEGEVPRGIPLTEAQLYTAIQLLRKMHDLATHSDLCNEQETICHHDFSPWNIIIKNKKVAGIIDFDELAPGARVDDLTYAIWTFLDLGVAAISDAEQLKRIQQLVNCYDLRNRQDFIPALLRQQNRILSFRQEVVATSTNQQMRKFSRGAIQRINQSIEWVKRNEQAIVLSLKQ
ncbi:MAG: phosphotransferase, partial [Bacteroidota bacterium]